VAEHGPSEAAYAAAASSGDYVTALDSAHDPALGLNRSVCLRDVVAIFADSGPIQTGKFRGERPGVVLDRLLTESSSPDREGAGPGA
jgi:hypothetical protein